MAELFLDVHLELDPIQLAGQPDPTRLVAELSHHQAVEQCHARGVTLRHPEPVDVYFKHAIAPLTGAAVVLVATRWVADGPEGPLGPAGRGRGVG